MTDINLTYASAHAYAYGYLSAETKATILHLRAMGTARADDMADQLESVLIKLEKTIEDARGK